MLNSTFTVFTCMSLFTKHNYKAKKLNYLTLKSSIQNEWTLEEITLNFRKMLKKFYWTYFMI
jgi:hypothetical protein